MRVYYFLFFLISVSSLFSQQFFVSDSILKRMNLLKGSRSIGLDSFIDVNMSGDWSGVHQRIMPRFDFTIAKKMSLHSGFLITYYLHAYDNKDQYVSKDVFLGGKYDVFQYFHPFSFFVQTQILYGDYAIISEISKRERLNLVHVKIRPSIGGNYFPKKLSKMIHLSQSVC